jgi:hypothetical protein
VSGFCFSRYVDTPKVNEGLQILRKISKVHQGIIGIIYLEGLAAFAMVNVVFL